MAKDRIISGITATGDLTLGNYIGAIKQLKQLQDDYDEKEIFVFVADLHALTIPIDPEVLRTKIKNVIKIYLSAGLNPRKVKLFKQSDIMGHTELFYYLLTHTNIGQLERMTQFKDKTIKMDNNTEIIPSGLLVYPILMVADIMLYNANFVPVGSDQKQHVELTRDIIEKINKKYNLDFNIPKPMILDNSSSRIMALRDPNKKMSKSDVEPNNTIFLIDEDEVIKKKIMSSLTDDENKVYFDQKNKPGVSNLLTIYSSLKNIDINSAVEELKNLNYKEFKEAVTEITINTLRPIREKFKILNDSDIENVLKINKDEVQKIAFENLNKIKEKIGL